MRRPFGIIRQIAEGGVQIGDSKKMSGLDTSINFEVTILMVAQALAIHPKLAKAQPFARLEDITNSRSKQLADLSAITQPVFDHLP